MQTKTPTITTPTITVEFSPNEAFLLLNAALDFFKNKSPDIPALREKLLWNIKEIDSFDRAVEKLRLAYLDQTPYNSKVKSTFR